MIPAATPVATPVRGAWPQLRRLWRVLRVLTHIFWGLWVALCCGAFWHPHRPAVRRRVQRWLTQLVTLLSVRVEVSGTPPQGAALVVCNHVSWVDIPVLASLMPAYFLSKAEVRDWPLIGWLAQAGGTLFIKRGSGESGRKAVDIAVALQKGRSVLLFPEGTTTDGRQLRRFHRPLFEAAVLAPAPVQPVALRYLTEDGDLDTAAAFIGTDSFHHHLWRLLLRDQLRVQVQFLAPLAPGERLAEHAHAAVQAGLTKGVQAG